MNRMTNLLHFLRTENLRKHNKNTPQLLGEGGVSYIVTSLMVDSDNGLSTTDKKLYNIINSNKYI